MSELDPALVAHARRLQRLFRWGERVHRLPAQWRPRGAELIGKVFTPDLPDVVHIWRAMQAATGCSDREAHALLARWFANQGAWAVELHDYPALDERWARERVDCDDRALLAQAVARGGLMLTYHSHHHNRLGAFLGLSGTRVWGIAATEDASPYKPWTGRFIRLINGGSEALFGGGRYLFTNQMRALLRESRRALAEGETVVTLCDNPSDSPTAVPVELLGRRLMLATGVIDLALEVGAAVHFAILYSDLAGGHRCRIAAAQPPFDAASIVRQYAAHLNRWALDDIQAWQGWAWWHHIAPLDPVAEASAETIETTRRRYQASRPTPGALELLLRAAGGVERWLAPPRP